MKIIIENKLKWKNIFIVYLNKNNKYIKKEELKFENKILELDIDLNKIGFIYFTNNKIKTDKIILSEAIYKLILRYNKKTNRYDVLLDNQENYGYIETYKLKDIANLPLTKQKTINVLLPNAYSNEKEYGLILLLDGQNMFSIPNIGKYTKKNDPYGGWQADVTLSSIKKLYNKEYIAVGIETTGVERIYELLPSKDLGKLREEAKPLLQDAVDNGLLEKTTEFIMTTVLDFIKSKYNINDNIGVCGSSAGGIAAHYIGMKYHNIFKFVLSLSPCQGFFIKEDLDIFHNNIDYNSNLPIYFYYTGAKGQLEKWIYLSNMTLIDDMISLGYDKDKFISYINKKSDHNEIAWRYAFNYALNEIEKRR